MATREPGMRAFAGKIRNIKMFLLQQRTRIQIIPEETRDDQINRPPPSSSSNGGVINEGEGSCSHANCSSYNMGFPLRTCIRVCSIIGMVRMELVDVVICFRKTLVKAP